jgi:membrane protein required for colicin V production
MIETHMNIFDSIVIGIMLLSCVFAFFRGFVREVLSLGAWIGAAIVTVYYFPEATQLIKPHFKSEVGAAGVGTLGLYITALIGFSLINMLIMKFFKSGSDIGMLDNGMGLVFGAARGAFIVSLGYFMLSIALPEKEYPDWLKQSVTRPYAEMGAIKLAQVAPEYLSEISTLQKRATSEAREQIEIDPSGENKGYNKNSANQLKQMMDGHE